MHRDALRALTSFIIGKIQAEFSAVFSAGSENCFQKTLWKRHDFSAARVHTNHGALAAAATCALNEMCCEKFLIFGRNRESIRSRLLLRHLPDVFPQFIASSTGFSRIGQHERRSRLLPQRT
jgi:hypothetical protein